jgi:hypothetical protein
VGRSSNASQNESKFNNSNKDDLLNVKNNILDRAGVVYMGTCNLCKAKGINSVYIGETGRILRARIKEHLARIDQGKDPTTIASAIAQHSFLTHGEQPMEESWTLNVLHQCEQTQSRRLLEALEITRKTPSLNRDKGVRTILVGKFL